MSVREIPRAGEIPRAEPTAGGGENRSAQIKQGAFS